MKTLIISLILSLFCIQTNAQSKDDVKLLVSKIAIEVKDSRSIISNNHAKELIGIGTQAIPSLTEIFTNSEKTKVYSECHDRYLDLGEIAIILADKIESMPYFTLTRIQNCTMSFCKNNPNFIEFYFDTIQRDGINVFTKRYLAWFKSEERTKSR